MNTYDKLALVFKSDVTAVWRGRDTRDASPVIIKELVRQGVEDRARLRREYEFLQRLEGVEGVPSALSLRDDVSVAESAHSLRCFKPRRF